MMIFLKISKPEFMIFYNHQNKRKYKSLFYKIRNIIKVKKNTVILYLIQLIHFRQDIFQIKDIFIMNKQSKKNNQIYFLTNMINKNK